MFKFLLCQYDNTWFKQMKTDSGVGHLSQDLTEENIQHESDEVKKTQNWVTCGSAQ